MAYNPVPTVTTGDLWTAANHNTYIRDNFAAGVPDIFTAKGQIAVASGADTASILNPGNDNFMLSADSTEYLGLKFIKYPELPIGGIILWYGNINTIPSGFVLCDGTNGTPDLRDKFIVGAGGSYVVGETGGASTHTHTQGNTGNEASHTHTQNNTISSIVGHLHNMSGVTNGPNSFITMKTGSWDDYPPNNHTHNFFVSTGTEDAHSHTNPTTGAGSAHSHTNPATDASSNLPPFKAVVYIMRIS